MEFCSSPLGACLQATGEDAASYLQGQLTQDLRAIEGGGAKYALLLNHKGRIQADAFVIRTAPLVYSLCSYDVSAAELRRQLEAFIVADDVLLEDLTAEVSAFTVFGEGAAAAVASLAQPGDVVFEGRRAAGPNVDWLIRGRAAATAADELRTRHGAAEIDAAERERRRIAGGFPAVPADAGPGELPQEAGLEAAISYSKGCYLGQEIMARLRTRGRVRRRLRRVAGPGEAPGSGTPLHGAGRVTAVMRTSAPVAGGFIGWALVAGDQPPAGSGLARVAGGDPAMHLTDA